MKKIVLLLAVFLALFSSCGGGVTPDPVYTKADVTYTVTGSSASLNTANVIIVDDTGASLTYSNLPLPATFSFNDSTYKVPSVWAQNTSTDFSSKLTVTILVDGVSKYSDSASGLYCVASASGGVAFTH